MGTQDKVAFITGANKGIGLETARGLGELGIAVVIASRDEAKGRAAAEKLGRRASVTSRPSVRRHPARGPPGDRSAPGGAYGKLDILVNNAGVTLEDGDFGDPDGFNTTSTVTPEILRARSRRILRRGRATQALLPLIRKARPAGS